jgi:hypothetical protein
VPQDHLAFRPFAAFFGPISNGTVTSFRLPSRSQARRRIRDNKRFWAPGKGLGVEVGRGDAHQGIGRDESLKGAQVLVYKGTLVIYKLISSGSTIVG